MFFFTQKNVRKVCFFPIFLHFILHFLTILSQFHWKTLISKVFWTIHQIPRSIDLMDQISRSIDHIDDISKSSISNIWIIFLYISLLFWLSLVKNHGKCLISKVIDRIKMVQFRHFIQFVGHFTTVLSQNGQNACFQKRSRFEII